MILLAEVRASGGDLRLRGSDLVASKVPASMLPAVKKSKPEIIRALRAEAFGEWDWTSHPYYILIDGIARILCEKTDALSVKCLSMLRQFHDNAYESFGAFTDALPTLKDAMGLCIQIASADGPAFDGRRLESKVKEVFGLTGGPDALAFA